MSQRQRKTNYWQDAPAPRHQLVLIPTSLEEKIPQDHPVRLVDEVLSGIDWTSWEAMYNGNLGQPPIHPSVMAKTMLFAVIRRIRSSRSIEYEIKHSIDFMWLTSGRQIDHTTLSEFRRKNDRPLKDLFKQLIQLAIKMGIANLSEICIDGSRILGDANKYKTWTAERLNKAMAQIDVQIAEAMETLEVNDSFNEDLLGQDISADQLPPVVAQLKSRREQLAAHSETIAKMDQARKTNGTKGPAQIPKTDPDSRILPNKEGGYAPNYTPMATTETGGGLIVNAEVLIGNVEHHQLIGIIDCIAEDFGIDVDQVLADSAYTTGSNMAAAEEKELQLLGPIAEVSRTGNPAERQDPRQPVAPELIPELPKSPQTKRFDKAAFIYDAELDCYFCPAGKVLWNTRSTPSVDSPAKSTTYKCNDCEGCPLIERCCKGVKNGQKDCHDQSPTSATQPCGETDLAGRCDDAASDAKQCDDSKSKKDKPTGGKPNSGKAKTDKSNDKPKPRPSRKLVDDQFEESRRRHREKMKSDAATEAYKRRQHYGELPFAVIKCMFDMRRFLLRGIEGVNQEWQWATAAFNLKKIISFLGKMRAEGTETNFEATV